MRVAAAPTSVASGPMLSRSADDLSEVHAVHRGREDAEKRKDRRREGPELHLPAGSAASDGDAVVVTPESASLVVLRSARRHLSR